MYVIIRREQSDILIMWIFDIASGNFTVSVYRCSDNVSVNIVMLKISNYT